MIRGFLFYWNYEVVLARIYEITIPASIMQQYN